MSCLGFKGGIGTASRVVEGRTVAVLLMTNFGGREELVVNGVPVGRRLSASDGPEKPAGSCIGIVVTDAAVDGASCARLARRVGLGLARAGSVAHHGSGEIFMAFGTGMRLDRDGKPDGTPVVTGRALDPLFAAVVEASEEAVLNSMFTAPTVVGRDGNTSESAHNDEVLRLLR
jgi:D-aminopeptidase